jgi:hypothetical protein
LNLLLLIITSIILIMLHKIDENNPHCPVILQYWITGKISPLITPQTLKIITHQTNVKNPQSKNKKNPNKN